MADEGFEKLTQARAELASLSGWGCVAVVVRCAERTLPTLTLTDSGQLLSAQVVKTVHEAVERARTASLSAQPPRGEFAEPCFLASRPLSGQAMKAQSAAGGEYTKAVFFLHGCAFTAGAGRLGCASCIVIGGGSGSVRTRAN